MGILAINRFRFIIFLNVHSFINKPDNICLQLKKYRYMNICWASQYKKFTKRNTYILCILCWVAGFLVDFPNIIGWGGHVFDVKTGSCIWDRLADFYNSLFFVLFSVTLPCICIVACYIKIFVYIAKSSSYSSKQMKSKSVNRSIKLLISLFVTFLLFAACW
jgi:hypothetical protein